MKVASLYRSASRNMFLVQQQQQRFFQPDFVPRDPKEKGKRYKYPAQYDPYGPRPAPSDKILELAEKIASLSLEDRLLIRPTLMEKVMHPKLERISVEGMDPGGPTGSEEKKKAVEEKTTFDVKLEKFDAGAKLKVIKEIRSFTELGLKEAKDLVEKVPVLLKRQVTKDEASSIIQKIKAVGGVAIME